MPLSSDELIVLTYFEQEWFLNHRLPTASETVKKTALSAHTVSRVLKSTNFVTACANRGIDVIPEAKLLTPEQLALANSLLDLGDQRSPSQKLKALEIAPRQYSAWCKQPIFRQYMQRRAEDLFSDAMPEAHSALVRNLQNGDLNSIKLFYEMTGRWSPKYSGELDIQYLMMKIIDILSRRLAAHPEILESIADELSELAPARQGLQELNVGIDNVEAEAETLDNW